MLWSKTQHKIFFSLNYLIIQRQTPPNAFEKNNQNILLFSHTKPLSIGGKTYCRW